MLEEKEKMNAMMHTPMKPDDSYDVIAKFSLLILLAQ
jgi:hypothetical protein